MDDEDDNENIEDEEEDFDEEGDEENMDDEEEELDEEEENNEEEELEEENDKSLSIASPIPDIDDMTTIFVIGDPHFRTKCFQEGEELIEKCVEVIKSLSPTIVVLLGDVLDTHEVVRNTPWKQACRFIEEISLIAPIYVLMGNHDLINQSQFLTDNHFFNPLKKWPNVTIVDKPIMVKVGYGRPVNVVMCPYTPPGRFIEALDTLIDDLSETSIPIPVGWQTADCIFAHQEFKGVVYGGRESEKGDFWDENFPPVISGHIHTSCQIGKNVFYPGSSIQVASDENPDKHVWNVTFDSEEEGVEALQIDKIDLGLKGKKEVEIDYSEISKFDFSMLERYYIKIKLRGTPEQFKIFRKSQLHARLIREHVKIGFDPIPDERALKFMPSENGSKVEDFSFDNILRLLVEEKSENTQNVYASIYCRCEIVYVE